MATTMINDAAANESASASAGPRVEVSKVIRAKRSRVFDAWTKPEIIRHWFGPGKMAVDEVTADVRVGGAYRIVMRGVCETTQAERPNEDKNYSTAASGVYKELVPDERIAFTWKAEWFPGESLVTVTLRDVEGGTEVKLVHEGLPTTEAREGHGKGWRESLEKLAGVVEG